MKTITIHTSFSVSKEGSHSQAVRLFSEEDLVRLALVDNRYQRVVFIRENSIEPTYVSGSASNRRWSESYGVTTESVTSEIVVPDNMIAAYVSGSDVARIAI